MGNKLWRTPQAYFDEQNAKYHFNVDAAADASNALVRPHAGWCQWIGKAVVTDDGHCMTCHAFGRYYTEETDGRLVAHYRLGDRVWCNPPYVSIEPWVRTAFETTQALDDVLWFLLLPVSTDTRWFYRYVWEERMMRPREGVEVHLPNGRIHFIDSEHPEKNDPKAPNLVVIFHPREVAS